MPKIKANKGFIFARVSTKHQYQDDHFGVPVQVERLKEYAEKNNITVKDVFEFPESAFRGKRKKFKEALDKVFRYEEEMSEPVALLFDEEDRLTRRAISDVMVTIDKLINEGKIELHFRESNKAIHKDSSHSDILVFRIKCDVSEHDSRAKSRKIRSSILYKLNKGDYPGFAPTGYLNDTENKTIVPDHDRAKGVKKVFTLYASGDYSADDVARMLRADGFTMKPIVGNKPRLIGRSDVHQLLNKRIYTGEFDWLHPETGELVVWKGNYKPIISKKLYSQAHKVLEKQAIKYGARKYSSTKFFKYRGLLTCGYCGCAMTPYDVSKSFGKKPGSEVRYHCTYGKKATRPNYYEETFGTDHSGVSERRVRVKGGGFSKKKVKVINCPQLNWSEKDIDKSIKNHFFELSMDKDVLEQIKQTLEVDFKERMTASDMQRSKLEVDLKRNTKLKSALIRRLAMEGKSIADDIREEIDKVKSDIERIKTNLAELDKIEEVNTNEIVNTLELCNDLHEQYDKLQPSDQRRLVMLAFRRLSPRKGRVGDVVIGNRDKETGVIKDGYIDVAWSEPFQLLVDKWFRKVSKEGKGFPSGDDDGSSGSIEKVDSQSVNKINETLCSPHRE